MDMPTETAQIDSELQSAPPSKRRSIIDSAAAIFCQQGYAGASIDAVACCAGVSRQTIYNQLGDKEKLFKAVVAALTERSSADFFAVLDTFPIEPEDLEQELTGFAGRLLRKVMCDPNGKWLMKLIETEGARYPELFTTWREYGPGKKHPAVTARFAQLAHAGYLELDDPALAARQFMSLLTGELRNDTRFGQKPSEADLDAMARNTVKTFLRAFGKRA